MIEALPPPLRQAIDPHLRDPLLRHLAAPIPADDEALVPIPLVLEHLADKVLWI